jgi:hypothetical protein
LQSTALEADVVEWDSGRDVELVFVWLLTWHSTALLYCQ